MARTSTIIRVVKQEYYPKSTLVDYHRVSSIIIDFIISLS